VCVLSKLLIGNAMLYAVETDKKDEIDIGDFLAYRNRLNDCMQNEGRSLPNIVTADVLDVTFSLMPLLTFGDSDPGKRFRVLVSDNQEKRDLLVKKLRIYYRNITPAWLRDKIESDESSTMNV